MNVNINFSKKVVLDRCQNKLKTPKLNLNLNIFKSKKWTRNYYFWQNDYILEFQSLLSCFVSIMLVPMALLRSNSSVYCCILSVKLSVCVWNYLIRDRYGIYRSRSRWGKEQISTSAHIFISFNTTIKHRILSDLSQIFYFYTKILTFQS